MQCSESNDESRNARILRGFWLTWITEIAELLPFPGSCNNAAIGVLLVLGVLGLGGLLYEIPDPTNNHYARMWEGFGVNLER